MTILLALFWKQLTLLKKINAFDVNNPINLLPCVWKNHMSKLTMGNFFYFILMITIILNSSCKSKIETQETTGDNNYEVCAGQITSKSLVLKSDSMDEETWGYLVKKMDGKKLISDIVEQVRSGKVKAYERYDDTEALSGEEIENRLEIRVDTLYIENADNSELTSTVVETNPLDEMTEIHFKEDWRFDPLTLAITKKVIAYSLCKDVYDHETGELRGTKRLFWIKTN